MELSRSDIVLSVAGRDQGLLFYVLDVRDDMVLIGNGKERKLEHPKWKKLKHVRKVARSETRTAALIRCGQRVLNSELRKDLAIFRHQINQS